MTSRLSRQKMVRVRAVKPLEGFTVRVTFTDGSQRDINLEKYLDGPAFTPIRNDLRLFRQVRVGDGKTLAWPNGADIDPDVLYYDLPLARTEKETA